MILIRFSDAEMEKRGLGYLAGRFGARARGRIRLAYSGAKRVVPGVGIGVGAWQFRAMSTITIPLPEEDLAFLRTYADAHGTSAEAVLARQARNLREHLQRPLHPDVARASGIIAPEITGRKEHRDHLEAKHG